MRPLSKVAPDWWDYTTLDREILDDAARLSADDLAALSRDGFRVKLYDTIVAQPGNLGRAHEIDTLLGAISFLGMTIPRFLLALIIIYVLAFKLNVQELGSFFSTRYGGAPWSWDKFVDLVKHVWPVIFIATFGGLAYNMRVMRANLLDVLNSQYVETARAKGLPEGAVIMKHAVPNALHPLVAYQGVVLPYMLTGEIEVAIVFGLATVGPAIVGSMGVGDVYVTATFMLVLATTLIIGNIIADLLLVALDPRVRLGGSSE